MVTCACATPALAAIALYRTGGTSIGPLSTSSSVQLAARRPTSRAGHIARVVFQRGVVARVVTGARGRRKGGLLATFDGAKPTRHGRSRYARNKLTTRDVRKSLIDSLSQDATQPVPPCHPQSHRSHPFPTPHCRSAVCPTLTLTLTLTPNLTLTLTRSYARYGGLTPPRGGTAAEQQPG